MRKKLGDALAETGFIEIFFEWRYIYGHLMAEVRLTSLELSTILAEAKRVFGERLAKVRLYGSRTDLSKSGGDIDLIIEVAGGAGDKYAEVQALRSGLCARLGEQKFDILVVTRDLTAISDRERTFLAVVLPGSKVIWSENA
jgi:predicted nucleotidyltransferase